MLRLNSRPLRRWTAGLGPLADYSEQELGALRGWRGTADASAAPSALLQAAEGLPEQFLNWTALESLQPIFDQASVGIELGTEKA